MKYINHPLPGASSNHRTLNFLIDQVLTRPAQAHASNHDLVLDLLDHWVCVAQGRPSLSIIRG